MTSVGWKWCQKHHQQNIKLGKAWWGNPRPTSGDQREHDICTEEQGAKNQVYPPGIEIKQYILYRKKNQLHGHRNQENVEQWKVL